MSLYMQAFLHMTFLIMELTLLDVLIFKNSFNHTCSYLGTLMPPNVTLWKWMCPCVGFAYMCANYIYSLYIIAP